jgi:hypothetical protein
MTHSPRKSATLVNSRTNSLLLTDYLVALRPNYHSTSRKNLFVGVLLQLELFEHVLSNNILIEADTFLTRGMQKAICVDPSLQIGLKQFAQIKVLQSTLSNVKVN